MSAFSYIIQVNILFVLLLGVHHFFLRYESNFQFNRYFLLFITVASFTFPFITIPLNNQSDIIIFPAISDISNLSGSISTAEASEKANGYIFGKIASIVYAIISTILLLLFSIKLFKLIKNVREIKSNSIFNYRFGIYITTAKTASFTFFTDSIIPSTMMEKKGAELIIKHERTHAYQWHTLDVMVAEVVSCLLFINPLKKKYKEYIIQNHEYIADAEALKEDKDSKYSDLLIEQTLFPAHLQIVSFFARPSILNRLIMMKNRKKRISKSIFASLIAIIILVVYACDVQDEPEIKIAPEIVKVVGEQFTDQHVFTIVENQAEPQGGLQEFYEGISQHLEGKYPQEAQKRGIEGIVYLQFIIEKDGSLSNIIPVKGIGGGCDQLAVEALKKSRKWIPGKQAGATVRSQRVIPIRFVL